jgi:hypothetical protein
MWRVTNPLFSQWDRGFESGFLQRRACCELGFLEATTLSVYGTAGIGVATARFTLACRPILERFGGARVLANTRGLLLRKPKMRVAPRFQKRITPSASA